MMKTHIRCVATIGALLPIVACAAGIVDAGKGFTRTENVTLFRAIKQEFGYRPAFLVNADESSKYYGLSRDGGAVSYYDLSNHKVLGWPLARWPYVQRPIEILTDHGIIGSSPWKEEIEYTAHLPFAGCLNQQPLRYGDIEGDGTNEVVLTLNGELIVFSPEYKRTVFAAFVDASDWYREPLGEEDLESNLEGGVQYQYLSEYLMYNGIRNRAHQSYTKLYVGDYDEDGSSDIVTWQKLYASNKAGEAPGFHLVKNELKHFERDLQAQEKSPEGITGQYLPQTTDIATIQQWVTDYKLTWQKGYPTTSECQGEAGQAIKEMSDPLLNDPDVLK